MTSSSLSSRSIPPPPPRVDTPLLGLIRDCGHVCSRKKYFTSVRVLNLRSVAPKPCSFLTIFTVFLGPFCLALCASSSLVLTTAQPPCWQPSCSTHPVPQACALCLPLSAVTASAVLGGHLRADPMRASVELLLSPASSPTLGWFSSLWAPSLTPSPPFGHNSRISVPKPGIEPGPQQ